MRTVKTFNKSEVPPEVWSKVCSALASIFERSCFAGWDVCGETLVDDRSLIDAWLLSQECAAGETVAFYDDGQDQVMDEHLKYLAAVHLSEPRSPDPESQHRRSLNRLIEACRQAGVDHQQVMRQVLDEKRGSHSS